MAISQQPYTYYLSLSFFVHLLLYLFCQSNICSCEHKQPNSDVPSERIEIPEIIHLDILGNAALILRDILYGETNFFFKTITRFFHYNKQKVVYFSATIT